MKSHPLKMKRAGEGSPGTGTERSKASRMLKAFGKATGLEWSLSPQEEGRPGVSTYHAYYDPNEEHRHAVEAERCRAIGLLAYQRSSFPRKV